MLSKFIFVYWGLGMVLAWVYMQTKDLRYSMLVHMCYNAMGVIVLFFILQAILVATGNVKFSVI